MPGRPMRSYSHDNKTRELHAVFLFPRRPPDPEGRRNAFPIPRCSRSGASSPAQRGVRRDGVIVGSPRRYEDARSYSPEAAEGMMM